MHLTSRADFPAIMPTQRTQYCWLCHATGASKQGTEHVQYACQACGKLSDRVLIFDPGMEAWFDDLDRLVHASCGVFILNKGGQLLLFQRTKFPFLLTIPAGHMDVGEEPEACARRETEEETGIRMQTLVKVHEGPIIGDSCLGGADIHYWHAFAGIAPDDHAVTLDGEGSDWDWYDIHELTDATTVQPVLHLLSLRGLIKRLQEISGAS